MIKTYPDVPYTFSAEVLKLGEPACAGKLAFVGLAGLPGPSVIHDTCIETGDRKEEAVAEQ